MSLSYDLIRPLLFRLEPERAHHVAMTLYRLQSTFSTGGARQQTPALTYRNLRFRNRLGLAAGFDKNGRYVDLAGRMGFGFVEIGTMTPKPQPGNPLPRVFRYPDASALVNRMSFPNEGVEAVSTRVERSRYDGVKGANISKNFSTPLTGAVDDIVVCFRRVRRWADYAVINISSPNTPGLRDLQSARFLADVCAALAKEEAASKDGRSVPVLVKVSPDMDDEQLREVASVIAPSSLAGVIATNTTLDRTGPNIQFTETGGISGRPVFQRSLASMRRLRELLGPDALLIGCGGIMSAEDARSMREAGADLLQIYTGLIYRGPQLVKEIIEAIG